MPQYETPSVHLANSSGETEIGRNSSSHRTHYHLPFPSNERFTGRDAILDALKEKLFVKKECAKLAVIGLGGVGKTQVVLQLAYWAKVKQPDYSIFWISALDHASFERAYVEIARQLDIQVSTDEDLKESVKKYLESEGAGKWLLIVDNVDGTELVFGSSDKPGSLYQSLPKSDNGLTLFTARSREAAMAMAGSDIIDLPELRSEEAMDFLRKILIDKQLPQDEIIVEELLRELSYLPLAIAQAAAYINHNQISIQEYLALLHGTEQDLFSLMSREFDDSTRHRGSHNAVVTTWRVSFDQIRRSHSHAAELLSFLSYIEPKSIPQSILPEPSLGEELTHAIDILCGYGFLVRREDEDVLDMHRLIHIAARVWVHEANNMKETETRAIQHLASVFPTGYEADRLLWREYLPHAQHALQISQEYQVERLELLYRVGHCLLRDGLFKEAIIALEEANQCNKQRWPEENPFCLACEHELASAYLGNRQIQKAIGVFEHIVAVSQATMVEDDHSRLASEHELARAYSTDRQILKAIEILEHVVAVRQRTIAEDDRYRLASEHELANVYQSDGQIQRAIKILEHVVGIKQQTLIEENHSRLVSEYELARAYRDDGQVQKAIKLFQHVVAVRQKTNAESSMSLLKSEHALARAYLDDQQFQKAIEILEHVVAVRHEALAENDCDGLTFENDLAKVYFKNGQIPKAIEILEHVVAVEKTMEMSDEDRSIAQNSLNEAYGKL